MTGILDGVLRLFGAVRCLRCRRVIWRPVKFQVHAEKVDHYVIAARGNVCSQACGVEQLVAILREARD